MDTTIHKILMSEGAPEQFYNLVIDGVEVLFKETDIYNSNFNTRINYGSFVNVDAEAEALIFLFVREISVGEQVANQLVADNIGNKVVITPNGLKLSAGSQYERENTTVNANQVLSIATNKNTDVYLSVWDN